MKNHRKQISSPLTPFYKFVFPSIWIGGFGTGIISRTTNNDLEWCSFLIAFSMGTALLWWLCMRLKKVYIENDKLVISNYFKTISVPLSEMQDVKENRFFSPRPAWIYLKSDCVFGSKIMFMPPLRFLLFFAHPTVEELQKIIMYRVDRI